jgi:hypothetical protein
MVWQQNSSGIFDPLQIYATLQDWALLADRISSSGVCRPKSTFLRGEWDQGMVWQGGAVVIRALMPQRPEALQNSEWVQKLQGLTQ